MSYFQFHIVYSVCVVCVCVCVCVCVVCRCVGVLCIVHTVIDGILSELTRDDFFKCEVLPRKLTCCCQWQL